MMFKEIDSGMLSLNPFTRLSKDWALVTAAGEDGRANPMTVSWGGMGVLWNKNVVTVYIRPQRYTHSILENEGKFTLSFYDTEKEDVRAALTLAGRKSGRDTDKAAEMGFHPVSDGEYHWYEESALVFCCKILYKTAIDPAALPAEIDASIYPEEDYHDLYIAEIVKVLEKANA